MMKSKIVVSVLILTLFGAMIFFGGYEKYSLVTKNQPKQIEDKINDVNTKKVLKNEEVIEIPPKENNQNNEPNSTNDIQDKVIETLPNENNINNKEEIHIKEVETTITKTQEQINDEYRKSIENEYGVTIKYADELGDYRLRGYLPTKLTDPNEIYENLNNIKTHVAYYPVGFFKEMRDFGMPLTIYLVKNIPNSNIAGIADKEFYDDIKITICTDQFFFRVFHHEVFHYIEAYMEIVGYNDGIFTNWDSLNPEGFSYGTTNSSYSYSIINPVDIAYFINDYGQTNDREDRATIFEDLMARSYELNNSYIEKNKIWDKAKAIAIEMDKYFNTVNSNTIERWERFIYN